MSKKIVDEKEVEGKQSHAQKKEGKPEGKEQKQSKHIMIVRVAGKDLNGDQPLKRAIVGIRGVRFGMGRAICHVSGLGNKKVGDLTAEEIATIETMLKNPSNYGVPSWVLNRRGDPAEGTDRHIVSADLDLTHKMDINELKKKRCYKGVRHTAGLPVRGQRTRSSFRKSGKSVGVNRVKAKAAKAGPAASDKKK
jgi:small subunit ribosomal protein S13